MVHAQGSLSREELDRSFTTYLNIDVGGDGTFCDPLTDMCISEGNDLQRGMNDESQV